MNSNVLFYIGLGLIAAYWLNRTVKLRRNKKRIPEFLKEGGVILDVRTASEFKQGSHPKSRNIPLSELSMRYSELDREKPVILCCASGARSAQAESLLRSKGFIKVLNVGPWTNAVND